MKGAQMFVEESSQGRRARPQDRSRGARHQRHADEAVRVARDLILRENVDFLFGYAHVIRRSGSPPSPGEQDRLRGAGGEDR